MPAEALSFVIGVAALALAAGLAYSAVRFLLHGKREPINALWFLGRNAPPQNDAAPLRDDRGRRRGRWS